MSREHEISEVLIKIGSAIKRVGYRRVINAMDSLMKIEHKCEESINYITDLVCKNKFIEIDSLKQKGLSDRRLLVVRDLILLLIKNNTLISNNELCNMFNITKSKLSILNKKFNSMDLKIKHEREFLDEYDYFNSKITEYKQQQ